MGPMCCISIIYSLVAPSQSMHVQIRDMRAALQEIWPRMLWTTLYNREHVSHEGGLFRRKTARKACW